MPVACFKGRLSPLPDRHINICRIPRSRQSPLLTPLWGHGSETRTLIQWRIWNRIDLPRFPLPHTSRWHGASGVRIKSWVSIQVQGGSFAVFCRSFLLPGELNKIASFGSIFLRLWMTLWHNLSHIVLKLRRC